MVIIRSFTLYLAQQINKKKLFRSSLLSIISVSVVIQSKGGPVGSEACVALTTIKLKPRLTLALDVRPVAVTITLLAPKVAVDFAEK